MAPKLETRDHVRMIFIAPFIKKLTLLSPSIIMANCSPRVKPVLGFFFPFFFTWRIFKRFLVSIFTWVFKTTNGFPWLESFFRAANISDFSTTKKNKEKMTKHKKVFLQKIHFFRFFEKKICEVWGISLPHFLPSRYFVNLLNQTPEPGRTNRSRDPDFYFCVNRARTIKSDFD